MIISLDGRLIDYTTLTLMNFPINKLSELRTLLKTNKIDAYIISSTDPHLGEYVPDHWRIISWLTGFTGSAATVVVTDTFAGLWTDSRYFIQAEKQLKDSGFILVKPEVPSKNDISDWLEVNVAPGSRIGLDGRIFSIQRFRKLEKIFQGKNIIIDIESDLISEIWTDRPALSTSPAFDFPVKYCGKERSEKITEVRDLMKRAGADYHLLTSSDDIMWLLNIRGNDLKYSPLLSSFAIIDQDQILLFAEETKIPFRLAMEFDKLGIVLLPYEETAGILSSIEEGSTLLLTPSLTSAELYNSVPAGVRKIEDTSIPAILKSVKNKTEIQNIALAMVKDGVALTKFFYWLEGNSGKLKTSELTLAEKLTCFRAEQENYFGQSFSPIVAWKANGALPHYSATVDSDTVIDGNGLLLIDSGGQYFEGTTDITRTIAIGRPTMQQIKDFTLVLKGHINLSLAKFPRGIRGFHLDILARKFLWENGLNYGHGTGHGVGFFLNVHEGPQNIGPAAGSDSGAVFVPGMLTSNEPALYREGEYGIRIENLILCSEDVETQFGKFLKFDTVSLCYIDKNLIDVSLLDEKELDWLNNYHSNVYEKLSQFLTEEERDWLKGKTSIV